MNASNLKKQNYGACVALLITTDSVEKTERLATTLYNCGVLAKPIDDIETCSVVGLSSHKRLREGLEAYFYVYTDFKGDMRYSKNGGKKKRFSRKDDVVKELAQNFINEIEESNEIIIDDSTSEKYFYKLGNMDYSNATDPNFS